HRSALVGHVEDADLLIGPFDLGDAERLDAANDYLALSLAAYLDLAEIDDRGADTQGRLDLDVDRDTNAGRRGIIGGEPDISVPPATRRVGTELGGELIGHVVGLAARFAKGGPDVVAVATGTENLPGTAAQKGDVDRGRGRVISLDLAKIDRIRPDRD